MSGIDNTAATLTELFRAGSHGTVAGAVVCDGPMALAVASHLTAEELFDLRAAVEAHLDAFGGPQDAAIMVGGEARGGPVMVPLRGIVRYGTAGPRRTPRLHIARQEVLVFNSGPHG